MPPEHNNDWNIDEDFDIDSVNVGISQYKKYQKEFGKKMYSDLRGKYDKFLNGDYDKDRKRLNKIFQNMKFKK